MKGDAAQSHHDAHGFKQLQFPMQVSGAVMQFLTGRLVCGGSTAEGGRNQALHQGKSVIGLPRQGAVGETVQVQSLEKPVAAAISREHSTRPVGAVSPRR